MKPPKSLYIEVCEFMKVRHLTNFGKKLTRLSGIKQVEQLTVAYINFNLVVISLTLYSTCNNY